MRNNIFYNRNFFAAFVSIAVILVFSVNVKAADVIWLSCVYNIHRAEHLQKHVEDLGNDDNCSYTFVIDLKKQMVARYEANYNIFHELANFDDQGTARGARVRLVEDNVLFTYETRGSRPPRPGEDFLLRVDKGAKYTPLNAYISTNIEINLTTLSTRIIRRYYGGSTIIYYRDGECSAIPPIE
jgi:hypothetical protein